MLPKRRAFLLTSKPEHVVNGEFTTGITSWVDASTGDRHVYPRRHQSVCPA